MKYLPTRREQEWLLEELARLIQARGLDSFVATPIVLPTSEFFPDLVDSLHATVDRITRRLLQYAGLGALDAQVLSFKHGQIKRENEATHCQAIAGCFLGIKDGCCRFGINVEVAPDVEQLAGVMAHEVAHAYRSHHGLCHAERHTEELLTDLTTAFLGFGVLSVNSSYRFRKSGSLTGYVAQTRWSTSSAGYLPPQALSFLLASQISVRGLTPRERKPIFRQLEPNQEAFVRAAVRVFDSKEIVLESALALPPRATWTSPMSASDVLQPLAPFGPHKDVGKSGEQPTDVRPNVSSEWNRGRPVFRIVKSSRLPVATWYFLFVAPGIILAIPLFGSWFGVLPFVLAAFLWRKRRGQGARYTYCSDAGCRVVLASDLTRCPSCGGEIMGEIDAEDDRLAMEEKVEEEAKRRREVDP